jgi:hypothetical protein
VVDDDGELPALAAVQTTELETAWPSLKGSGGAGLAWARPPPEPEPEDEDEAAVPPAPSPPRDPCSGACFCTEGVSAGNLKFTGLTQNLAQL